MSNENITLSDCVLIRRDFTTPIAFHAGCYYHADDFYAAVKYWVRQLQAQPFQRYALFTEDAYPFAVLLFALFHAGKQVWIAGNNRPGTAQQLQQYNCRLIGDWDAGNPFDYYLTATNVLDTLALPLSPLNLEETQLVIFTSGSTGQPKPIEKHLIQFQLEITALEKQWGKLLGSAEILATVSHQHIYGLLFRILWPLSAGRCFHSPIYINPETLVNAIQTGAACWVASPAHLKRLDQNSPWIGIVGLSVIFSSGGALNEVARQQINANSGQQVIEIYGSSETGGIGWRQYEMAWQLFDGLRLSCLDGRWQLSSPYLQIIPFAKGEENEPFQLDDQISLQDDGRFILHGRADRIAKIEEKRLSLSEMERRMAETPWVAEAFTVAITKSRDVVGAAVVLTEAGSNTLKIEGRNALIRQLRASLYQWFDSIVLPRKWLFLDSMPLTTQGKIDQYLLNALLDTDNQRLPQVQGVCIKPNTVKLTLKVPEDLIYFPNHFSTYPILPGVVQIAWAEYFGKLFFAIDQSFLAMEVIKFVKAIQPGNTVKLTLNWNMSPDKLHFQFRSEDGIYSSGRLVYAAKCREQS
jgi:acyl-CoA synthetase (AMP-forming)/AMP-acid ligase II/3-hydroxymyristoyl/3-hydroxydecanoyl-(acyl carrier protein) dehydratase